MVLYELVRLMDLWVDSLDNVMFGNAPASSPRLQMMVLIMVFDRVDLGPQNHTIQLVACPKSTRMFIT